MLACVLLTQVMSRRRISTVLFVQYYRLLNMSSSVLARESMVYVEPFGIQTANIRSLVNRS